MATTKTMRQRQNWQLSEQNKTSWADLQVSQGLAERLISLIVGCLQLVEYIKHDNGGPERPLAAYILDPVSPQYPFWEGHWEWFEPLYVILLFYNGSTWAIPFVYFTFLFLVCSFGWWPVYLIFDSVWTFIGRFVLPLCAAVLHKYLRCISTEVWISMFPWNFNIYCRYLQWFYSTKIPQF